MKVGVLTASMSRQAGGLFWSVRELARSTQAAGCDVEVFAVQDGDSALDLPLWEGVELQVLEKRGPVAFGFMPGLSKVLEASNPDVLHTHGIWMYPSLAALLWSKRTGRPYLISPRGMLDPWAVRNSGWKKRLVGWWYEHEHLRGAHCIHALCTSEAEAIRAFGLRNPICVIPNGIDLTAAARRTDQPHGLGMPEGTRVLLYIGRLHPKKNLLALIDAWSLAASRGGLGHDWHLIIAGWDQGDYEEALKARVDTLGLQSRIRFPGPLFDADKDAALRDADAFVLPSLSEGLPMAVLEAWAYGLPVLMTPQCNLPEGIALGAAQAVDPDVESLAEGLTTLCCLDAESLRTMGERGRRLVEGRFTWPRIAGEMCAVYAWVLGRGPKPDCVIED